MVKKIGWAEKGLKFQCTGCGGCCTGAPGYVFLTKNDVTTLSLHLQISEKEVLRKYCRFVDGKYSLLEKNGKAYDCIFLKEKRCSVYEARPVQCKTYPWWAENLQSKKEWEKAAKFCEGINHPDAPIVPLEKIEKEHTTYLDSLLDQNFSF